MAAQFEAEGLAPFLTRFERFDVLRDRPVLVHRDGGDAAVSHDIECGLFPIGR